MHAELEAALSTATSKIWKTREKGLTDADRVQLLTEGIDATVTAIKRLQRTVEDLHAGHIQRAHEQEVAALFADKIAVAIREALSELFKSRK